MKRIHRLLLTIGIAAFALAAAASGKIRGSIVSIADGTITVNDGADHAVSTTGSTQYQFADDASGDFSPIPRSQLKSGEYVTITLAKGSTPDAPTAGTVYVASDEAHMAAAWKHQADVEKADKARAATQAVAGPRSPLIPAVKLQNQHRFFQLHDQYVARARQGNVDLLFLGDSITQFWSRAQQLFDSRYGPRAANFGVSGDRIEHVLWRIENGELDGISPKVIVLLVGTNNSNVDDGKLIAAGIQNLVDKIHEKTPHSKILLLSIFPRNKSTDKQQMSRIEQANSLIAKMDNGSSVRVLNLGDKFLGPDGKLDLKLFPDGIHPNAAGYKVWADSMQPLLDKMMKGN